MTKTLQLKIYPNTTPPVITLSSNFNKDAVYRDPETGNLFYKVSVTPTTGSTQPVNLKISGTTGNSYIDLGPEGTAFDVSSEYGYPLRVYATSTDVKGKTYRTERITLPYGVHTCVSTLFKKKLPGVYAYKIWVGKITETDFEYLENCESPTYTFPLFTFA